MRRQPVLQVNLSLTLSLADQCLALMLVGSDSHEHPCQSSASLYSRLVVQTFPVLTTLVSVCGNRTASDRNGPLAR
jgi:hypothetical protein